MSDILKSQPGPSRPLNTAKPSPSDIPVTTQPNDERKLAKTLSDSLKVTGQSTYSTKR
ncbi:hypothetical protein [Bradyrhizobium sp.]|uniref:hypothetical protein n=1 Tax=Bradyrhizobium sp. TaxID=376 RepID=UPI003BAEC768